MNLQLKLVIALLVMGMVPVVVSAILIDRITVVAQSFASNQAERMRPSLEKAQGAYRQLVDSRKELYREIARSTAKAGAEGLLDLRSRGGLIAAELRNGDERTPIAVRGAPAIEGTIRHVDISEPLPDGGELVLTFAADESLTEEYQELGRVLQESEGIKRLGATLPSSYRTAFLAVVGGLAVMLSLVGVFLGRRVTLRLDELVDATRQVAQGDLAARVIVHGNDELAELARAFNRMVGDLETERQKSMYLQRIGTWQDVARKLAHEIKNPLTPIQLAVQQVQSSYKGDDERFGRLLGDAADIVGEEIDSLRRLVDAFSSLGRLPRVDAKALDFSTILDDLGKDPVFRDSLIVKSPAEPTLVRGDRLLLRRVIANLVENGMQAGEQAGTPGEVVVSWFGDGDHVVVTVDDCGPGVPADKRESIFEPYVTSKDTGTGLGLAISKKIAIEHSGSLEVSNERAPTGGARFVLRIPAAVEGQR
jgi:nitrogen fixation/metabolism regulation signal transduction histidine kinase